MRFNSLLYWAFLAGVIAGHRLLPPRWRKPWLLAASWAFYGSWHLPYLGLLVGSAALNSLGGRWIVAAPGSRAPRGWAVLAVNLGLLGLFRYLDWGVETLNQGLALAGAGPLGLPGWVLPLGISFYLFQGMSYVIDLTRRRESIHPFFDFQLYIAFFPQLVAGPIMRAKELIPQLAPGPLPGPEALRAGLWTLASGLALKIVLADGLAPGVDAAFSRAPSALGALDVAVMATGFGLQIYFDFAAYSRIAIGSGQLLGLKLVENFNHPYVAASPAEFWARWHMSLSRWIRDYLFYPLVGRGGSLWSMVRAALLSMLLCGLWHGPAWRYLVWGLFHGALIGGYHALAAFRRARGRRPGQLSPLARLAAVGATFSLVTLGWIFFRATSLIHAAALFAPLLTPWAHLGRALPGTLYLHVALLTCAVWAAPAASRVAQGLWAALERRAPAPLAWSLEGLGLALLGALCLIYLKGQSAFIYFQF